MGGSSARFRNIAVFESAPDSAKEARKNSASSCLTPMAQKTTAKPSSLAVMRAWRAIWAASSLCGSPAPENTGSFCPRMRVFMPSMAEMPVTMRSRG